MPDTGSVDSVWRVISAVSWVDRGDSQSLSSAAGVPCCRRYVSW